MPKEIAEKSIMHLNIDNVQYEGGGGGGDKVYLRIPINEVFFR